MQPYPEFSNGLCKCPLTAKGIEQAYTLAGRLAQTGVSQIYDSRIPGGESPNDMRQRFVPLIEELAGRPDGDEDRSIVLVSHGGLYRCMLPFVLANGDLAFTTAHFIANTGYVVAEQQPGGWRCTEWCGERAPL